MRHMYDAATAPEIDAITPYAEIVAGYIDGAYVWTAEEWGKFPAAIKVHITVFATDDMGDCLDVETGDATPLEAPRWVEKRRAAGIDPAVYMNASTWPLVIKAFADAGVAEPHYWVAEWGPAPGQGYEHLPEGAAACQYDHDLPYDVSVCSDAWPPATGGSHEGLPTTPPDPVEQATMSFPDIGRDSPDSHDIRKVQGLLAAWGYALAIDGAYGPITESLVRDFQAHHPPLTVDGVAGPHTVGELVGA